MLRDINLNLLHDSGWGQNTILDVGLDSIGSGNPFTYWHVGNSAAAVVEAQTGLQGWIDSSNQDQGGDVEAYGGSPDYEYSITRVKRFAAGDINDTVREVGAGTDNVNNSNFYARHLVTPVLPVSVDQVLDVAYRHTIWPLTGDVAQSGAITMDGEVFDTLLRGADIDKTTYNLAMGQMGLATNFSSVYEGDIGDNLSVPAGNSLSVWPQRTNLAYGMGNHYRDVFFNFGLNHANLAGGIRSLTSDFTTGGQMQVQFDSQDTPGSGIPKDDTKTMDLTLRQSWVRHV
jgi:hypothetical protein